MNRNRFSLIPGNTWRYGILFLLFAGMNLSVQAQYFKAYYKYDAGHDVPLVYTVKDLVPVSNREWVIAGELKEAAPTYKARTFMLRVDPAARPVLGASIYSNLNHTTNEVRVEAVAADGADNLYLAGTSIQDPTAPSISSGSERTLTAISKHGHVLWSRMQPNHSFNGVAVNEANGTLVTLSGPNHSLPGASLMFTQLETSGKYLQAFTLKTPTEDEAVRLLGLPAQMGYLALARYDKMDARRPYLVRLGPDLEPIWTYTYSDGYTPTEVTGVSLHPDGYFVVSGSLIVDVHGRTVPFLLGVNDEDGQVRFMHTFDFGDDFGARANDVVAFRSRFDPSVEGMLMAGEWYQLSDPTIRRSYILMVDGEGVIRWARNYSNFEASDLNRDEVLSVIRYEAASNQFLAAGTLTESLGTTPYRRWSFLIRASADDGILDAPGASCETPLAVTLIPGDMEAYMLDTDRVTGGSLAGFSYFDEAIPFDGRFCSYGDGKPPIDDNETAEDSKPVFARTSIRIPYAPAQAAGMARIFDLSGREVRQLTLPPMHSYTDMSLSGISAGIYLLHVQDGLGKVTTQKFRVQ
ncbi:MAG: T9SS C-terminal target domain-containing protein [Bacteroidetes bacterium]|nr:MAG: T9SS C-terminal target domain-containing protein [Bacteroidota bacterium]